MRPLRCVFDGVVLFVGGHYDDRIDESLAAGPAITPHEATEWIVTAVRARPVHIAPRVAIVARALDTVAPRWVNVLMQRTLNTTRLHPARLLSLICGVGRVGPLGHRLRPSATPSSI